MKRKFVGLLSVIGFLLTTSAVLAQSTLPRGGDNFNTAVSINPGEYITDRVLEADEYEFYKISVEKQQVVKVKITTGQDGYAEVAVYNPENEKIGHEWMIDSFDSVTLNVEADTKGTYYIRIGSDLGSYAGNTFKISLEGSMPSPTPEEDVTRVPTQSNDPNSKVADPTDLVTDREYPGWFVPAGIAGVLLVVVVAAFLMMRKPKEIPTSSKKSENDSEDQPQEEPQS